MKTLIIAEAGVNHNGDIELAKQLIKVAKSAGADLVKFQMFKAENLVTKTLHKASYQKKTTDADESQFTMLKKLEFSRADFKVLIEQCHCHDIGFFSTAFDVNSFDTLIEMGLDRVKIPSGELTNLPLLRHMARLSMPVMLSTGMATLGEIEVALEAIEKAGTPRQLVTILHCTTEYPAPMAEVNLKAMLNIKAAFGVQVGYSDHTLGIEIPVAAVAMGARVIEKHFTLDRTLPGPDHQASLEPQELKAMISAIRNVEVALGDGIKRPSVSELKNKLVARKSLVAIRAISAGEIFSADNVGVKRPGIGISPMQWDDVMGRVATRNYFVDELIEL